MKNISVLVDFTETSKIAIKYACGIAAKAGATLQVLHVINPQDNKSPESVKHELEDFSQLSEVCESDYNLVVETGEFMEVIPGLLKRLQSDLVVIATHGIKGIFHTMQGAEVLKLIQKIPLPSLILQGRSPVDFIYFKNILFPIAAHDNFEEKINQTAMVAGVFDSNVVLFVLYPEKGELPEQLKQNLEKSQKIFEQQGVKTELVKETSRVYGIGYAKQALEYAANNKVELFSIMAHAASDNSYFGNVERSEFILNERGIPVLCCNA